LHAWGPSSVRAAILVRGRSPIRVVASAACPRPAPGPLLRLVDHRLLGAADDLIATGPAEAQRYQHAGRPAANIRQVPPGVAVDPVKPVDVQATSIDLPATARVVVCVGPLRPEKGYQDAIWAFDILRYVYDDLRLVIIGGGPERARLEVFARSVKAPS